MIVEAILVTGLTLAVFCLGVAVGAIVENRYRPPRHDSHEVEQKDTNIIPLDISLAQQIIDNRPMGNVRATPLDWSVQDPDVTLEMPVYEPDKSEKLQ